MGIRSVVVIFGRYQSSAGMRDTYKNREAAKSKSWVPNALTVFVGDCRNIAEYCID